MTPTYKDVLRKALADLDAHDAETSAALAAGIVPPGYFGVRTDRRIYLNACVMNACRELLKELDALELLKKERGE